MNGVSDNSRTSGVCIVFDRLRQAVFIHPPYPQSLDLSGAGVEIDATRTPAEIVDYNDWIITS
jgi:hypothetical protein